MKRIGILGNIGSGKSFVAQSFGYPVFNADKEVSLLYKKNKLIFNKLRKILPKYFIKFPIDKNAVIEAILDKNQNLGKIIKIVHIEIRKKLILFLRKNKNKKFVILDIPLLLENRINKSGDILIFVESNKINVMKRLKKRKNYNQRLFKKFQNIQLPLDYKKKKSQFVIKNNFTKRTVLIYVKNILTILKNERNSTRY
tara:strand:+ start:486 stop:1079 length:594 start_codon:yes stop_codon:yes gene_type:complete